VKQHRRAFAEGDMMLEADMEIPSQKLGTAPGLLLVSSLC
jgi:hypothetical protein